MNKFEQMDFNEILNEWQDENSAHHFEDTGGVTKLEKLLGDLGYKTGNYMGHGHEIANFLSDNSGAIEAILNWITEQDSDEWRENLIDTLPEPEEEEEEEEETE